MAWDFSDSSFRPSIVLKATHSKLTSMEFLTGNTLSLKHQLLAAGDETGTLHIFEMPRSLVRPAHKEAALMSAFLDREREVRITVVLLRQSSDILSGSWVIFLSSPSSHALSRTILDFSKIFLFSVLHCIYSTRFILILIIILYSYLSSISALST
jgi:hypothetical protein